MARDLYSVLGVPKTASDDALKKAFRKLAVQYHPDKNPGKSNEDRFKEINRAHEILSDKDKRALYDEFGEDSLQQGFDAERARMMRNFSGRRGGGRNAAGFQDIFVNGGDFGDVFGDFFGRGGAGGVRGRSAKGPDQEVSVTVDFLSALKGTTVKFSRSDGGEPIIVRIPAGIADGGRVKVQGQGGEAPGVRAGDLHIIVKVTPHPLLKREGDDLRIDVPINVVEAYEGAKIRVPTIEGEVTLKVPPRTQSGQVLRLKGKGAPRRDKSSGDLYVRFLVQVPDVENEDVSRAIEALRPYMTDPRANLKL